MRERMIDSYDYMKTVVDEKFCSQYIDSYQKFGWKIDENMQPYKNMGKVILYMKRSRNIINKVELTRLQRHYEHCMDEINTLESSKNSVPTMVAISCGVLGCVFISGSVFAVTHTPPMIWLMILLAIPGFFLWGAAYFSYKIVGKKRLEKVNPLIDAKYDEAYEICEKAVRLIE